MKKHLSITQTSVVAAVTSIVGLAVGFGLIDNHTASVIVGLVGPVFGFVVMIANAIHALADGNAAQAAALLRGPNLVRPLPHETPEPSDVPQPTGEVPAPRGRS